MRTWTSLLIAAPVAVGLLAAPAAHADWHHRGGWDGGRYHHHDGIGIAGALLGLGAAALLGGVIASAPPPAPSYAPPPVTYAPPPAYYPPPAYAAPPDYYTP
jgi:hypothetical protein